MASKTKKRNSEKEIDEQLSKELTMLDKAAKSIFSLVDPSYVEKQVLSSKDQKVRAILDRELEIAKGVSNGSIIDFVTSVQVKHNTKQSSGANLSPNSNELFTQNINDIFGYFQDIYKNRFLEMSDLKFIAKFIPALGEAVKTTIDSIVSSDNVTETVNFKFELPSSVTDEQRDEIMNEIKRMEKELKLRQKIKNIVYKKTCITGMHYVYKPSYNKIFEEYDKIKKQSKQATSKNKINQFGSTNMEGNAKAANESFVLGDVNISDAMESVRSILSDAKSINTNTKMTSVQINDIMKNCKEDMPIITCNHSYVYEDALESVMYIAEDEFALEAFTSKMNKKKQKNDGKNANTPIPDNIWSIATPDGTKGVTNVRPSKFNINGTYIKYIDCKNIIPVKVFEQTIGYFLIHPKTKKNKNSAGSTSGVTSIGSMLFSGTNVTEERKHEAIERIVDSISEGILNNFDKKFVTKNMEYKKLIADCIIANGLTDKDYNIQFIPAEDIIEFKVNENEEGFGESILADSLFPAKLLLTMIVCRMLNYVNKTGSKTIAHIHKGPVDAFTSNQTNRVIRDLQEQNVTFNDLLSPNLVFNKFNRDGNIALPTGKNGQRLVEFETQEGQNIDMSPDYEQKLENMAILGTGVPTVIMEYAGSADFAKQLVSANIKFAGRIANLQSDLEEPTTELYRALCKNSNMSDECKTICEQSLEVKLPRPRVLVNGNNGDYIRTIVETAEAIADVVLGRDSVTNTEIMPNGAQIKEKIILEIVKDNSPYFDWDEIEEMVKRVMIEYQQKPKDDEPDDLGGSSDMSGNDMDSSGGEDDFGSMGSDMGEEDTDNNEKTNKETDSGTDMKGPEDELPI